MTMDDIIKQLHSLADVTLGNVLDDWDMPAFGDFGQDDHDDHDPTPSGYFGQDDHGSTCTCTECAIPW